MILYHYTCADHGAPGITATRILRGHAHPWLRDHGPLVHLTDLDHPDKHGLGLTARILTCDRTAYRVTVDTSRAIHWPDWARPLPRALREAFEGVPGARPMHWWIGYGPLPIVTIEATAGVTR